MIMVDYGRGSGRDYVIIVPFFKTEWRQKSVFNKNIFQHTTRVYAEYDPISHFDRNACFRVNIQNFQKNPSLKDVALF